VSRQAALMLGLPLVMTVVIATPLGLWLGSYQWLCASVAFALVVMPGLATLIVAKRMSRSSPYGQIAALFLGTFVRLAVGFGGAVLVFLLSKPTFHADPISFLLWLLGTYLTTLVVETILLARNSPERAS
jgi:hypothetical protein